jgi:hypothetical protein
LDGDCRGIHCNNRLQGTWRRKQKR